MAEETPGRKLVRGKVHRDFGIKNGVDEYGCGSEELEPPPE